jgi:hypothetical protein
MFWEELRDYLDSQPVFAVVLILTSGDRYLIEKPSQIAMGRYVLSVYLEDGSVLMYQVSNIVCADIKFDE